MALANTETLAVYCFLLLLADFKVKDTALAEKHIISHEVSYRLGRVSVSSYLVFRAADGSTHVSDNFRNSNKCAVTQSEQTNGTRLFGSSTNRRV